MSWLIQSYGERIKLMNIKLRKINPFTFPVRTEELHSAVCVNDTCGITKSSEAKSHRSITYESHYDHHPTFRSKYHFLHSCTAPRLCFRFCLKCQSICSLCTSVGNLSPHEEHCLPTANPDMMFRFRTWCKGRWHAVSAKPVPEGALYLESQQEVNKQDF